MRWSPGPTCARVTEMARGHGRQDHWTQKYGLCPKRLPALDDNWVIKPGVPYLQSNSLRSRRPGSSPRRDAQSARSGIASGCGGTGAGSAHTPMSYASPRCLHAGDDSLPRLWEARDEMTRSVHTMDQENVSATLTVAVPAARVFAVLADPTTHSLIDGTGWVQESVDRAPLTEVGQIFRVDMYHPNHPDRGYQTANKVHVFEPPRSIGWLTGYETGDC